MQETGERNRVKGVDSPGGEDETEKEGARRGIFGQQSASLCWKI